MKKLIIIVTLLMPLSNIRAELAIAATPTVELSRQRVLNLHPEIGKAGSDLNLAFVEVFNSWKTTNPQALQRDDWPELVADEAISVLSARARGQAPPRGPSHEEPPKPKGREQPPLPQVTPGAKYPDLSDGLLVTISGRILHASRKSGTRHNPILGKMEKVVDGEHEIELTVNAKEWRTQPLVLVQWFFIGRDTDNKLNIYAHSDERVICSKEKPVVLLATASTTSKDKINILGRSGTTYSGNTARYTLYYTTEKAGGTYIGWVARALDARGRTVGSAASTSEYLTLLDQIELPESR